MARILTADDAAFMRKVIKDTLSKNGFTDVVEAVDGADAVAKYDEFKPDLVILDITMPNSAMGQEAMVIDAIQNGAKDFIVKPFKPDRIMKTVTTILGNP